MGGTASTADSYRISRSLRRSDAEIVQLMMPVYYSDEPPTPADIQLGRKSWNYIIDDTSPEFLRLKQTPGFTYPSCVMMFYDSFYSRLFDVHPMSRSMFKSGMKTQGKFLVKMISMILTDMDESSSKFNESLIKLAEVHNDRGVKAIEYGIVGEVLFWSIKHCIGDEAFDKATHGAWVRIFSRILRSVVPVAVAFELRSGGEAQADRLHIEQKLQMQQIESRREEE